MQFNDLAKKTIALAAIALMGAAVAACGDSDNGPKTPENCTAVFPPSNDDDQASLREALLDAEPGDRLCLTEGEYIIKRQLDIDRPGVTLIGVGREATMLDYSQATAGGARGVYITGDDVTLQGLTVAHTQGDAVEANTVRNIVFRDVGVYWDCECVEGNAASCTPCSQNGAYGLYPVKATGVIIDNCYAYGAADAGIYVGQSKYVLVKDSVAEMNFAGIEIENTTDAEVVDNVAFDNTAGILIFNLPGPEIQGGERTLAHRNEVYENNTPNFARVGSIVSQTPPGTGFMILASDYNEIRNNEIRDNISHGVLIVNYLDLLGSDGKANPNFNLVSMGNWIHTNNFVGNGVTPKAFSQLVKLYLGGIERMPDVVYDGCEAELEPDEEFAPNCMQNNGDATYANFKYCKVGGGGAAAEAGENEPEHGPIDCAYNPVASQTGVAPN